MPFYSIFALSFHYMFAFKERRRQGAVLIPITEPSSTESLLLEADLACFQGHYNEAVKALKKAGRMDLVVELYVDLRRFEEAKEAAAASGDCDGEPQGPGGPRGDSRTLLTKHAEWARTTKDHRAAANMFIEAGDFAKATEIAADNGWADLYVFIVLTQDHKK